MKFNFITMNDQVSLADDCAQKPVVYEAPEDFEDGSEDQAMAFLAWWAAQYDIEWSPEVKYWDGRTMIVDADDGSRSVMTFIFEWA